MCLAFPGKLLKIDGKKATVQYPQEQREALISNETVVAGDYVMVQMGAVVRKLTRAEAKASLKSWGFDLASLDS